MSVYNHIFDQFQRYQTASKIVASFPCDEKSIVKILEVGANAHFNLKEYIPYADITFSDINQQDTPNGIKFVQADAADLPFSDDEFDFVISLDVLEHVPAKIRKQVIAECSRVASRAFILACPVSNKGLTEKRERSVNEFFKKLHGIDHPWLIEHFEEGLPEFDDINEIINSIGVPFQFFQSGQLEWWELLMKMHFIETVDGRYKLGCDSMYEYYNKYLHTTDVGGDCYRTFWVIGDDLTSSYDIGERATDSERASIKALEMQFKYLETLLQEHKQLQYDFSKLQHALDAEKELLKQTMVKANQEIEYIKCNELRLTDNVNRLNEVISNLHDSTSWKLTMPLRLIARLVRGDWQAIQAGFKHRLPLLDHALNPVGGGFRARLGRAISLLLNQGPKAVINKIKTIKTIETSTASLSDYQTWLQNREQQDMVEYEELLKSLPYIMKKPLISVVMPTYNTDEKFLRLCIESVINQSYSNWELCIADDASPDNNVVKVLKEYQRKDKRIKCIYRKENGHISAATNSALELVTGEWVALLDHDDELHVHALAFVVKALNDNPGTQFIYTDEDKIDEQGRRSSPHFKSDWNLDLLYSQNYVSHLGVYRADIVNKIGGFRVGYEGSQDFDLLLRYSREIDHKYIVHIPHVLYHWRMVEGSTALASDEKSYTTEAGVKALNDYFSVLGENVTAEAGMADNIYKVNWPAVDLQGNAPLVSLIIPTYNAYEITKQAIDSILTRTTYQNFEILLVDNNSDDPTALQYFEEVSNHPKVTLLRYPYAFNYSAINNFAVNHAKGSIIGLINNDVEVISSEWLTEMVSHALRSDIGCVGAMLYYPNDTIQHAGVIIGIQGVANHSHKHFVRNHPGYFRRLQVVQNYSAVTAACLLVRKSIYSEVNGLNENDLTVAFNDVDFCLKVQKAGYRNLWTPYAELYHHESISRGAEDNPEKIARFNKEIKYMIDHWKTDKVTDFAYNPNLTTIKEDFSLR